MKLRYIALISAALLAAPAAFSQDVRNTYIGTAAQIADGTITLAKLTGLGTGVATLLAGNSSGTGGPAGTISPTFTGTVTAAALTVAGGTPSFLTFVASGVNFNSANTDTTIPITLPTGFTRYNFNNIRISGASASITTATYGVFTAAAAGGHAVVASGSTITVNTASEATNNNMQASTIVNANSMSFTVAGTPNIYFRVQNPQGSAATANVAVTILLLP